MPPLTLLLILVAVIAGLEVLAKTLKLPLPALLVSAGIVFALVLAFVPGVPAPTLDPETIFLVFIPAAPLLDGAHQLMRDFKRYLASISLLAVGLVLATTVAVAAVAHALISELTWPAAFVLGAIVSPPDPIAAIGVIRHLAIPKPIVTILEGEGLVNDATALVAYRMAVVATVTGSFSIKEASLTTSSSPASAASRSASPRES